MQPHNSVTYMASTYNPEIRLTLNGTYMVGTYSPGKEFVV